MWKTSWGLSHWETHDNLDLKYECELYMKQPLTPCQRNIIAAYHTLNHRLAIETGRWTITPISRDTKVCHFFSHIAVENEAHFALVCPLYNPFRDKFPSKFENVVLGSLKSFFQLDQQVNITLFHRGYCTCHSRY